MGISVISLFENNKDCAELKVYLLGEDISNENKEIITSIGNKYNRQIIVIDVPKLDIPEKLITARWPLSAFTRLYAAELLPAELDRILYLDCDTIVRRNIHELNTLHIDNAIFWGVKDCIGKGYKKNIGIAPDGAYINAGVLLINLTKLRETNIKTRLESFMYKYKKMINYADQDVLNGAFYGEIGILPPEYDLMTILATYNYDDVIKLRKPTNYYSKRECERAVKNPIIIHYTTNMLTIRPWFANTNHPFAEEFLKYMRISPWKDKRLEKMIFDSLETEVIGVVEKLPKRFAINLLGFMHASIKPLFIRLKGMERK